MDEQDVGFEISAIQPPRNYEGFSGSYRFGIVYFQFRFCCRSFRSKLKWGEGKHKNNRSCDSIQRCELVRRISDVTVLLSLPRLP